jgi:hypothetical protein
LLQRKLLSKRSKLRLYWATIRPVVAYACEAWVLKITMQKLMRFERKILKGKSADLQMVLGGLRLMKNLIV